MKSGFELLTVLAAAMAVACSQPAAEQAPDRERPFRCATCHAPEFAATTHPPHAGVRPESCGVCHSQSSWHGVRIEHPWWELTGAHALAAADRSLAGTEQRVKCFWCHRGEPAQFEGTARECIGCHAEDRQGVQFPGHDKFSASCESCHSTDAWKPARRPADNVAPPAAPSASSTKPSAPPRARPTPTARPAKPPSTPSPAPITPAPITPTPVTTPPASPVPDITSHASRHR